jgi:phosphoserine phosphatase RsbU/P
VLELAAGGHPAPFLVRKSGEVEHLAVQGPLIGVIPAVDYAAIRVVLDEGDKLILYTDGLGDARAPQVTLSETDIADLIAAGRELAGQELAQFLESHATGDAEPRDDIAILVLEAVAPGASALSVHYFTATS